LNGISEGDMPNHGAGLLRIPGGAAAFGLREGRCALMLRLDRATRSDLEKIQNLKVGGRTGRLVALSELIHSQEVVADKSIYHKNLLPVTYVTGDVAAPWKARVRHSQTRTGNG